MLILWANCMPIAFELQQGSLWVFTKLPNLLPIPLNLILNYTLLQWRHQGFLMEGIVVLLKVVVQTKQERWLKEWK